MKKTPRIVQEYLDDYFKSYPREVLYWDIDGAICSVGLENYPLNPEVLNINIWDIIIYMDEKRQDI